MKRNVGGIERALRVLVGLTLFGMALFHVVTGTAAILAYLFGTIVLGTAVFAFCPAWILFKINTSARRDAHAKASGAGQ